MNMAEAYSTLYRLNVSVGRYNGSYETEEWGFIVPAADIVSISIIHNYDVAMYPIIRVRLYTDLSYLQQMTDDPDNIGVILTFNGNVYKMNKNDASDGNGSLQMVDGSKSWSVCLKAYIENKNALTSKMDSYDHGIKKDSSLNENIKVPVTLYAYDERIINYMKFQVQGIYKNMDITSIIESVTNTTTDLDMDPVQNQTKYDQVLLPNISARDTIMFFDRKYG